VRILVRCPYPAGTTKAWSWHSGFVEGDAKRQGYSYSLGATQRNRFMKRAKQATLVLCLFILYSVLLSQGLKASAASAFFGALAAVPLTVHLYHRVWPSPISENGRQPTSQADRV
jgi:hypothetical protein